MRAICRSPLHPLLKRTIAGLHYSCVSVAARLNVGGKLSIPSAQTDGGTILKGFLGRARSMQMWVAKGL